MSRPTLREPPRRGPSTTSSSTGSGRRPGCRPSRRAARRRTAPAEQDVAGGRRWAAGAGPSRRGPGRQPPDRAPEPRRRPRSARPSAMPRKPTRGQAGRTDDRTLRAPRRAQRPRHAHAGPHPAVEARADQVWAAEGCVTGRAPADAPAGAGEPDRAPAARVSVQPVTTWSSTSSTRRPAGTSASSAEAAADGGDALGGVGRALARARRRGRRSPSGRRPALRGSATARRPGRRSSVGRVADSTTTIAVDLAAASRRAPRAPPAPAAPGTGPSGGLARNSVAQRLAVAEVGEPGDRPALLGAVGDLALEVDAEVGQRGRPHLARLDHDAGPGQPRVGLLDAPPSETVGGERRARRSCRSGRSRRPRGRRAGRAGTASGTGRCRGSRASPAARARGPRATRA